MTRAFRSTLRRSAGVMGALILWECIAVLTGTKGFIPSPIEVILTIYSSRAAYLPHVVATLRSSSLGLLWGALGGCLVSILITLLPRLDFLLAPCTFVFSIP